MRTAKFMGIAAALTATLYCGAASAQSAEDFYKGETMIFVVGFGAGGGYDTYARLIAPEIEKQTGGTVVVENRPGAGGLAALNGMFRGEPNPREIHMTHGEAAFLTQLTGQEGRRFDVSEMQWLGRVASEPGVVLLSAASPFKSIEDMRNADRPIKFSAASKADGLSDYAAVFCEVAGLNCQIITGCNGSRENSLAAIRGEVDGFAVEASSAAKYAAGDELGPIATLARERTDAMPESPFIFEAVEVPADKEWLVDFREAISKVGRSVSTGPGVDADKVAYLRGVIDIVMNEKAFTADARAKGRDIRYLPGAEQQAIIEGLMASVSAERLEEIKNILLVKYFP